MSFSPIALTIPNYRDFSGFVLKAFIPSITTPKAMALAHTLVRPVAVEATLHQDRQDLAVEVDTLRRSATRVGWRWVYLCWNMTDQGDG